MGGMLSDGMLLDDEEQFDDLIEKCAETETRANQPGFPR